MDYLPDTSKQKPSVAFSDFNDVTLGSSAIFQNLSLRKRRKDREPGVKRALQDPWLSVPIFQWFWLYTVSESPPLGISPREAKIRILEVGPLHNFLEKWWSEPYWVGKSLMILNQVASQVKMIVLGCQLITNQDP